MWCNRAFQLWYPIANSSTTTTSTFCHVAAAALVTTHRSRTSSATMKCRLLLVNIYAHQSWWDTNTNEDERGEQLADEIDAAEYTILNENEATRLPTNGRSTSPDISLASNDIALLSDRSVSTSLASDHLPILNNINPEQSAIDWPWRTNIYF